MSSILSSKYKTLFILLIVILFVELVVRSLPMDQLPGTGVFLANQRSKLLDASEPEYDYIIFGESRTLSLMGHKATPEEPFSIYNFSVPAMGSRYFTYYLRKYMQNRKQAPAALIFAGDPTVFRASWNIPIHDPQKLYTEHREDSLGVYLKNRFTRRIEMALGIRKKPEQANFLSEGVWEHFSHRYLHLFSLAESFEQYSGAERLFMLYERLPLVYETYRWREPIAHYLFGFQTSYFKTAKLPSHCKQSCRSSWDVTCYPSIQRLQQNKMVADRMKQNNGQINLADLKSPMDRMKFMAIRKQVLQLGFDGLKHEEVDLEPLKMLAKEARKYKIKLILSFTPTASIYKDLKFLGKFDLELAKLMQADKNIYRVNFKKPFLDEKYFIDNAHYLCEGSNLVNQSFYGDVVPQIRKLAPTLQK